MKEILRFNKVYKSFYTLKEETKVLEDISFNVFEGEIVALVGPSGCGKTTLLNLICGLISPDEGEVIRKGKVGYMFQKDQLFEWRTIYKNITIGPEISKIKIDDNKIINMLKKYDLYDFKDYYPKELSGGMRQRVALLRTLALDPDILLLDEPFSSLDYQTKIKVQEDMYKIIKEEKKTVILVTHDISEAISLSNNIMILSDRPATLLKDITLDFKNLSPFDRRNNPLFPQYFHLIWSEINDKQYQ